MKVEVVDIDRVTKKVEVVVPGEQVTEISEKIYEELKKKAKIKGFRPGKTPRSILATYYKEYIEDELKKRVIETTMPGALSEVRVSPVTEPVADFIEEEGRFGYTLLCEVLPEIELPSYKGIEVEVDAIHVTDEEINTRIESMRGMHAEMITRESGAGAQKGDFIIIKYQGYMNGKPVKDIATEAYPLELGTSQLMPEFESALYDMKAGETKEINIDFPEDYPNKDIANKTVLFKVEIKDVREKRLPEVNDEFAKDINFENMEKLREGLKGEIEKEKHNSRRQLVSQKITETLISGVDIPVPKRLLEKRTEAMMEDAKMRFNTEKFTEEELQAFQSNFKKDFEKKAEERIKADIILAKIAEMETIKLEDDDVHNRMKKIAEETKRPYDDVKGFYEKYDLIESMKNSIMQEKTIDFLRDNATIKEKI
ncbi:MAG: trigger factor [Proteobacteria bacterium]|nr:trigger factor [Pseudomonadota bacterium]